MSYVDAGLDWEWTPQQQLSVVTTVWGVTPSTQSGPHPHPYQSGGADNSKFHHNPAAPIPFAGYRQANPGVRFPYHLQQQHQQHQHQHQQQHHHRDGCANGDMNGTSSGALNPIESVNVGHYHPASSAQAVSAQHYHVNSNLNVHNPSHHHNHHHHPHHHPHHQHPSHPHPHNSNLHHQPVNQSPSPSSSSSQLPPLPPPPPQQQQQQSIAASVSATTNTSCTTQATPSPQQHSVYHHSSAPPTATAATATATAAMVAAAATATATATASVVALQDNNHFAPQMQGMMHHGQQFGGAPYASQRMSMMNQNSTPVHVNMMPSGVGVLTPASSMNKLVMQNAVAGHNQLYPRRMAPYPNPVVHMNQKRQQQSPVQMPPQQINTYHNSNMHASNYNPSALPQFPNGYGGANRGGSAAFQTHHQSFAGQQNIAAIGSYNASVAAASAMHMHVTNSSSRPSIRQSTPPYSNSAAAATIHQNGPLHAPLSSSAVATVASPMQSHQYCIPSSQYQQSQLQQQQQQTPPPPNNGQFQSEVTSVRGNYQHSPIPVGNPTPPLTPASNMPPYVMSPNAVADMKPNPNDVKCANSSALAKDDELRLTFPVRDGIILAPFRLEHNLAVSNHVFQLKPTVHQTLMWRSDLELQLKCFHHEDKLMSTNWPASVQVSVNATPLVIDRGENKTTHKPLHLKDVCQPGRNTIQITVSACCCSHLFVLQLVHRPIIRSVLQGLLRRRLLTAEHCVAKIKRNFNATSSSSSCQGGGGANNDRDAIEQTALKVSLKCPITCKKITLPARGHECKHIQCFDLESYLQLNCDKGVWRCPVCNKPAQLENLEIDQYIWGILNNSAAEAEEVTIDASAHWKPSKMPYSIKIEEDNDRKNACKGMSPDSMNMPTTHNWDIGQSMSPYIPPDMNSIASGSMMTAGPAGFSVPSVNVSVSKPNNNYDNSASSEFTTNNSHSNMINESLDPLNAIEKSISDQVPHTPLTPGSTHTPIGGTAQPATSVPSSLTSTVNAESVKKEQIHDTAATSVDLPSDLNFDPAAVIEGEAQGQEGLNLLPDNVVDPMDLLSYLDPPLDLATPPSSSASSNGNVGTPAASTGDDILSSLFD